MPGIGVGSLGNRSLGVSIAPGTTQTLTATVSNTPLFIRGVSWSFAATYTQAATLSKTKVLFIILSVVATVIATRIRQATRPLTSTTGSAASLSRAISRTLVIAITTAVVTRILAASRIMSRTVTGTASWLRAVQRTSLAQVANSVTNIKFVPRSFAVSSASVATIKRLDRKSVV